MKIGEWTESVIPESSRVASRVPKEAMPMKQKRFLAVNTGETRFQSEVGKPSLILLASSWRSGSSFLADIVRHSSRAWYVFEPLRKQYGNNVPNADDELQISILRDVLNCNHSRLEGRGPYGEEIADNFFFRSLPKLENGNTQSTGITPEILEKAC